MIKDIEDADSAGVRDCRCSRTGDRVRIGKTKLEGLRERLLDLRALTGGIAGALVLTRDGDAVRGAVVFELVSHSSFVLLGD